MRTFRLAIAQINSTVGDLDANSKKILDYIDQSRSNQADLVIFPELAIPGYPPEDLIFKSHFVQANIHQMNQVVKASTGISVVVGFIDFDTQLYNASAIACDGELVDIYHKIFLPNHGVFDEKRYFKAGVECPVYTIEGAHVGVNICEDIWNSIGPTDLQRKIGAELIVSINSSPFHIGKRSDREKMLSSRASGNQVFVAYVNMVGGQDELVFDGASMIVDPNGNVVAKANQFEEDLMIVDLKLEDLSNTRKQTHKLGDHSREIFENIGSPKKIHISDYSAKPKDLLPQHEDKNYDDAGEIYAALILGTRDYVRKCGFKKVLVALSGGIDSSLVSTIAVDALGSENVVGISMPSRYSSESSVIHATEMSDNLGIEFQVISIDDVFSESLRALEIYFRGSDLGLAEENLQSRIRGNIIMALSNKFGWMVLTTGNKSEMSVGYATIYGDMAGGYSVIKDVPKTMVYDLVKYRNSISNIPPVPLGVLEKPPSAELRPNQKDEDSLPPYEILDPILKFYVEEDLAFHQIVRMGFDKDTVRDVISLVERSEYKRRQSAPGIKITPRNFGRDRRMPIANRYNPF